MLDTRNLIPLFALPLNEPEFKLDDKFIEEYSHKPVAWGPVGYVTYKRTYSRRKDNGTSEEWFETVRRVVEGAYQIQQRHCRLMNLYWNTHKAQRSAQEMYKLIFEFKFLPPGRGLWMMGTDFIKSHGSAPLQNCGFLSTENIDEEGLETPLAHLMDLSMLGVGVGFDTLGAGKVEIHEPQPIGNIYKIPDSREGWIGALRICIKAWTGRGPLMEFDYSDIRPAGEPIKGFGGVAAGPGPLKTLIEEHIPEILEPLIGEKITSSAIVDLSNAVGVCVVSGNVRRSAEIAIGNSNDYDFMRLKDPETAGPQLMSWRWASNNSISAKIGMNYEEHASYTARNGEPGYVWLENMRKYGRLADPPDWKDKRAKGCNPCVEQTLEDKELCNLVETFPAHHNSLEEYKRTLKFAYLYAKTVTLLPTHIPEINKVMLRNRRIGTSQSGVIENFQKIGRREHFRWCDEGYKYLKELDTVYSEWLGIPTSIKITSLKPSGSVSKLPGAMSGMHRSPSEYYIQRITFAENSDLLNKLIEAGYPHEQSAYSKQSVVVEFPVKQKNFEQAETEVPAAIQLADAVQLQKWWADNQVSCTVKFEKNLEGPQIKDLLEQFEDGLKGISFLPYEKPEIGENGLPKVPYVQAPWEPITKEEYERRVAVIKEIDPIESHNHEVTDAYCDSDRCEIPGLVG